MVSVADLAARRVATGREFSGQHRLFQPDRPAAAQHLPALSRLKSLSQCITGANDK